MEWFEQSDITINGPGEWGPFSLKKFDKLTAEEKNRIFSAAFSHPDEFPGTKARMADFFLRSQNCTSNAPPESFVFRKATFGGEDVAIVITMNYRSRCWKKTILPVNDKQPPKRLRIDCSVGHEGDCATAKCRLESFYINTEELLRKISVDLCMIPSCQTACQTGHHAANCQVALKFKH